MADAPDTPKPSYELYSLTVRFGSTEETSLPKRNLPRLTALPSAEEPILVYLGLEGDGKTAVFLVDASAEPQGDGTCKPNPAVCETIHMRVGDTEFFDVTDETGNVTAQYQLDLLDIKRSTTASAAKAKAARAKASKAGRRVLRTRRAAGPLRYRYDAKSGTVRKLSKRAFKAQAARMARAAHGQRRRVLAATNHLAPRRRAMPAALRVRAGPGRRCRALDEHAFIGSLR